MKKQGPAFSRGALSGFLILMDHTARVTLPERRQRVHT